MRPRFVGTTSAPLAALAALFVLSRLAYEAAGVRFDATTYTGYWQFVDPQLLRTDLARTILHLHTQPPLMNLMSGLILQAFPDSYGLAFELLYYAAGLILAGCLYTLAVWLGLPRWLGVGISSLLLISPATVLYEHWLFYAYPVNALLVAAAAVLWRFAVTRSARWGALFSGLLAALALTWSLFHLVWLLAIAIIVMAYLRPPKTALVAAMIPVLVVMAWYGKNLWLAGQFTASSWAGMNFSRITTFCLAESRREQMVREGYLSEFALYPPFRNPERYLKLLPETPRTGVPVLDQIYTSRRDRNRHHIVYAEASRWYFRDALRSLRAVPGAYTRCVGLAFYIAFHSPSDYERVLGNREAIDGLDLWWSRLLYGQWQHDVTYMSQYPTPSPLHIAWFTVAMYVLAAFWSPVHLWRNREEYSRPEFVTMFFMWFNVAYVVILGNLADVGENNRFRFTVDPFVTVLVTALAWRRISSALHLGNRLDRRNTKEWED